jgi:hypothetical protein
VKIFWVTLDLRQRKAATGLKKKKKKKVATGF